MELWTSGQSMTQKYLICDIDETLIHIVDDSEKSLRDLGIFAQPQLYELRKRICRSTLENLEGPRGKGQRRFYWGVTRPHLKPFLQFALQYFAGVGIWSAGKDIYVYQIVRDIFRDLPSPPKLIYHREHLQWKTDDHYDKPLEYIFQEYSQLTPANTFMLDDRAANFEPNPENGLLIPPYEPAPKIQALTKDDTALLQLRDWLMQPAVMNASDIRDLDKTNIFY